MLQSQREIHVCLGDLLFLVLFLGYIIIALHNKTSCLSVPMSCRHTSIQGAHTDDTTHHLLQQTPTSTSLRVPLLDCGLLSAVSSPRQGATVPGDVIAGSVPLRRSKLWEKGPRVCSEDPVSCSTFPKLRHLGRARGKPPDFGRYVI